MKESLSALPEDFYYEELSKYLLHITNSIHKKINGNSLSARTASIIEKKFTNRLSSEPFSAEDCLKTLYAIRIRRNARTKNPLSRKAVKSKMIDSLVRHYHSSRFCSPYQDEFSTALAIRNDFPSLAELNANSAQIEGKSLSINDEPTIHSIQKMFLDFYKREASRSGDYLRNHPLKKIRAFKSVQKNMRYRDTEGFIKKAQIALAGAALAATVALGMYINDVNNGRTVIDQPITNAEQLDDFVDSASPNQKLDEAINQIYSDPSKLQYLGFSEDATRDFERFVQYSSASDSLTAEQQEEYARISNSLIGEFNLYELENSDISTSSISGYSINSNSFDYVTATIRDYPSPENSDRSPIHSVTLGATTSLALSAKLEQQGQHSQAVLNALKGSLCTLESVEGIYGESIDESSVDRILLGSRDSYEIQNEQSQESQESQVKSHDSDDELEI